MLCYFRPIRIATIPKAGRSSQRLQLQFMQTFVARTVRKTEEICNTLSSVSLISIAIVILIFIPWVILNIFWRWIPSLIRVFKNWFSKSIMFGLRHHGVHWPLFGGWDISTANISREKEESQEKLRGFPCFSLSVRNPGGWRKYRRLASHWLEDVDFEFGCS